jgi:aryl-alcohol dehydrogenase-like predicted oxidoreductase
VLDACRELEVTLIAYSPLGMGLLTGKYGPGRRPGGIRRVLPHFRARRLAELEPLLALLREIADHHDATPSQVAPRWLIEQHALPVPRCQERPAGRHQRRGTHPRS